MHHFRHALLASLLLSACGDHTPPAPPEETKKSEFLTSADSQPKAVDGRMEVAAFHRSRFTQNFDLVDPSPGREFSPPDPARDTAINDLIARARPSLGAKDALTLIERARESDSTQLGVLARALLKHPDVEVRGRGLSLLEGFDSTAVLPVVDSALKDTEAEVRMEAVEVLSSVRKPEAQQVYKKAIQDTDPNVRMAAFTNALELDDEFKKEVLMENASSPVEDIARSAMVYLEAMLDKTTLPTFISGLDHRSPLVRDQVAERMNLLFDQSFSTAAQARAWWQQNQYRYGDDLVPVETN